MATKHVLIEGKVQGVFFRASAKEKAESLGLTGWVKNTPAGNVEAVASGDEEAVDAFVDWCRMGPARASVKKVVVSDYPGNPSFPSFQIVRG